MIKKIYKTIDVKAKYPIGSHFHNDELELIEFVDKDEQGRWKVRLSNNGDEFIDYLYNALDDNYDYHKKIKKVLPKASKNFNSDYSAHRGKKPIGNEVIGQIFNSLEIVEVLGVAYNPVTGSCIGTTVRCKCHKCGGYWEGRYYNLRTSGVSVIREGNRSCGCSRNVKIYH